MKTAHEKERDAVLAWATEALNRSGLTPDDDKPIDWLARETAVEAIITTDPEEASALALTSIACSLVDIRLELLMLRLGLGRIDLNHDREGKRI